MRDFQAGRPSQVFAVLASRQPLPAYAEWKQKRGGLPWRKQRPGGGVWVADLKGTYPRRKGRAPDRGTVGGTGRGCRR